jgi:cytochrome P450
MNHYWQKAIGTPNACPHGDTKAGGSLIGQYHNNKTWQRDRDLAMQLISAPVLAERSDRIAEIVEDIFSHEIDVFTAQHPGQVIDAGVLMGEIVLRVVLRTVFPGVEADLIQRLGTKYLDVVTNEAIPTVLQLMGAPTDESKLKDRMLEMSARLRQAISDIATAVRQAHARGELSEQDVASPMNHYTIFGLDGKQPDDQDLISIYGTFLIGAHETTAHLLTWALYELGRDPDLYKTIQKEVDAFSANHQGRAMTPHDYDERPKMLALLFELNRLHPGIAVYVRSALDAGTIPPDPETGIGSFVYPADTIFMVDVFAMHLDPETYFKPKEFHIERFLEGINPDMSLTEQGARVRQNVIDLEKQFKWLPFAAGPGNCPGRNFNMIEFFLVMDCLMRSHDFILANPDVPPGFDESSIVTKPLERIGIELVRR